MPAKFALDKAAPLQTTLQTLLWLGVLVISAIVAALLIVTLFGSH
jgi:Mg/Co/Ni transporter MgtE